MQHPAARMLALAAPWLVLATALAGKGEEASNALMAGGIGSPSPNNASAWETITHSIEQFGHVNFLLKLVLGLGLAVLCALMIAWHPRRSTRVDPLSDLEERKALILLGLVGAVIAELGVNQNLAFVIFGIGALIRFRTVLDNPKITGKAILVVVIGLACGMGQWAMAGFVTLASWGLIFWLDSHISARVRVKVSGKQDMKTVYGEVQDFLQRNHCRVKSAATYEDKRQMVFLVHIPSDLDPTDLESGLRTKLPKGGEDSDVDVRVG